MAEPPQETTRHESSSSTNGKERIPERIPMVGIHQDRIRDFLDRVTSNTRVSRYLDLPMIVVMGDTSSGKSSLLASLSNVELPSSQNLTTKCPILLQMKKDSSSSRAHVSISWQSSNNAPVLDEHIDNLDENPLELTSVITRAQTIILEHTQKPVAPDVICVSVSSCRYSYDLTLMDLPGLVRSRAHHEDSNLQQNVHALWKDYLHNARSIILAVLPANVDFHNSQILSDAQAVDPHTTRTLPVLTKPDLIDPGAEQAVVDLLKGKHLTFSRGFHMVKCRGQAALDNHMTIEQAKRDEQVYFETTEPWKSVATAENGHSMRFGTLQLSQTLAQVQLDMMQESLPAILKEIRDKQRAAKKALAEMGHVHSTATDRRRYYQDLCHVFLTNLQASLTGRRRPLSNEANPPPPPLNSTRKENTVAANAKSTSAAAQLHTACATFRERIGEGSLATIRTITEGAQVLVTFGKGAVRGEVVHVEETYACVDYLDESEREAKKDVLLEFAGYHSETPIDEDDVWSDGSQVYIARANNVFDSLKKIPLSRIRTDPTWLHDKLMEYRTDDLPCFLNVDVFKNIVTDFVENEWKPHCQELLETTQNLAEAAVRESLHGALGQRSPSNGSFRYPALQNTLEDLCRRACEQLLAEAQQQVQRHLEMEKHPYTQDRILMDRISQARHAALKCDLESALRLDQEGVFDTQAIKTIVDAVFEGHSKKSMEDHMAEEMEIVLDAYGQVATQRIVDRVPMICWEVFRSLTQSIRHFMWACTDETLEQAMRDSHEFTKKYLDLKDELAEMNKATEIFSSLSYK